MKAGQGDRSFTPVAELTDCQPQLRNTATRSVIVFTKNRSGRSLMIFVRGRVIVRKLVSNTVSQSARKKACIVHSSRPDQAT